MTRLDNIYCDTDRTCDGQKSRGWASEFSHIFLTLTEMKM